MNLWFLVPARGGSKGIPFKNTRSLAGKPLIRHVIDRIGATFPSAKVVLSSDSNEILQHAVTPVLAHKRSPETASDKATIDEVAVEVAKWLVKENGASREDLLFTVQPTSPLLSEKTVRAVVEKMKSGGMDTVLTLAEERKLTWSRESDNSLRPNYAKRVNRQELVPFFRETGAVVGCRIGLVLDTGTRFGRKVDGVVVGEDESVDIDTFEDWLAAEYALGKKRIAIRCDGSRTMGFGHLYRALALCQSLAGNGLKLFCRDDGDYQTGYEFLKKSPFEVIPIKSDAEYIRHLKEFKPHVVVNDVLDTTEAQIKEQKSLDVFVVNFEDTGKGAHHAHLVINDLYPPILPDKHVWSGVQYALLHPQFEAIAPLTDYPSDVAELLIVFGGTDEGNLTLKAIDAVINAGYKGNTTVVVGPGNRHLEAILKHVESLKAHNKIVALVNVDSMAKLMQKMHFAISSAGRTLTELMTFGVPTLALCQNVRELRHSHASIAHGVVNLSLGSFVPMESLSEHIRELIGHYPLRQEMRQRMLQCTEGRRNAGIIESVLKQYEQWRAGHYGKH